MLVYVIRRAFGLSSPNWTTSDVCWLHRECVCVFNHLRVTEPLKQFFQLKTEATKYLVMFVIDSDLNLDILVQIYWLFHIPS